MNEVFSDTLWLTFKVAAITTMILFVAGIPIAWALANSGSRYKVIPEALLNMPVVLPPSVLGFYLLMAFSPAHFPGNFLKEYFNLQLAFSFEGIVAGSVIFNLPFMISPLQAGFQNLPPSLKEAAYTLGKSRWTTLTKVLLPNMKPSLVTAAVLTFAHSIGEFGVVLMIGGSIPGKTRVASIAIYDEIQGLNYHAANQYALILFAVSFLILLFVYTMNRRYIQWKPF